MCDFFDMKPECKHAPARLGRVLIIGLGKSGRSALAYCAALLGTRIDYLAVAAGASSAEARAFVAPYERAGVRVLFDHETIEGSYDLCIASPGIPQTSAFYRSAQEASAEIISEIEFSWRESPRESRWVAVTGTNGKTTTTALIAHVLASSGLAAQAVGNIGEVCLDAVAAGGTEVFVAEVSSYQLASTVRFAPDVAVILNITPDHLSWHGGFAAYRDAKFKVLANMGAASCAVLDATDDEVRGKIRELRALAPTEHAIPYIPLGTVDGMGFSMKNRCGSENAAYVADGVLQADFADVHVTFAAEDELLIKGSHNSANALAAACAAFALGVKASSIEAALRTFRPLEHRIEPCGSVRGVAFVNDSKATNVDATLKAYTAFPAHRTLVLLGGCDKHTDLADLVCATHSHAKAAVCFGDAGARFYSAFEAASAQAPRGFSLYRADHLADALTCAVDHAEAGDTVLLSPACSSFDEFCSYQERGRAFKDLVAGLSLDDARE